jgi:cytochrome c biogenesis protein CcmG, thiol:disulfide interchange protein DsbE
MLFPMDNDLPLGAGAAAGPRSGSASERPRRAGRFVAVALVALFLALLAYGLSTKGHDDRIDQALASGRAIAAPAFTLDLLDQGSLPPAIDRRAGTAFERRRVSLRDLRGTPVVLNMWASWCTPCREEARRLEQGWARLGPRGLLFLGLDIQDLRGDARAFSREFGVTYPSVRDAGRDTANRYGATGIPETFFVDARGRVVGHVIGVVSERQLRAGALAALTGRVAGTSAGGRSFKVR